MAVCSTKHAYFLLGVTYNIGKSSRLKCDLYRNQGYGKLDLYKKNEAVFTMAEMNNE